MEQILMQLGLQDKIGVFKQKNFSISTFKYIMSSQGNDMSKRIVMEDTGLTSQQMLNICAKI